MSIVLGIDGGMTKANPCGLAVVDTDAMRLVYTDAFTPGKDRDPWVMRLRLVAQRLHWLYQGSQPRIELIAYEMPPFMRDPQAAIKLAHIGGLAIGLAALYDLPVVGVQPTEAKVALAGNSQTDKPGMIAAAAQVFGVELAKDCADAVGVALAGESLYRRQQLESQRV